MRRLSCLVVLLALGCGSSGGEGSKAAVCTPEEKKCDGADLVKCSAVGDEWAFYKECANGCEDAACIDKAPCIPKCEGKACGDDGCGGSCGGCTGSGTCNAGQCCAPACTTVEGGNAECGANGCGGTCGECPVAAPVCDKGHCVPDCTPACVGKECGEDGCGGSCGTCPDSAPLCEEGKCEPVCKPSCAGKECGSDGCGDSCGDCDPGEQCEKGVCECVPQCAGKECGMDGCGGVCGKCAGQDACEDGKCVCQPDCEGLECGPDGCGGTCGECQPGADCVLSTCECEPEADQGCCGNNVCWLDSCGGEGDLVQVCALGCEDGQCSVPPEVALWIEEAALGPGDLEGVEWDCIPIPFLFDCEVDQKLMGQILDLVGVTDPVWGTIISVLGSALFNELKKPDPLGVVQVFINGVHQADLDRYIPYKPDTFHPVWSGLGWEALPMDGAISVKVSLEDYDPANQNDPFGSATITKQHILDAMNAQTGYWVNVAVETSNTVLGIKIVAYPVGTQCSPECTGKQCGSDGCGGSCGECPAGQPCTTDGKCAAGSNDCGNLTFEGCCSGENLVWCEQGAIQGAPCADSPQCGWAADYMFYNCGTGGGEDPSGDFPKTCPPGTCVPECKAKECGDNGCGGSCGECPAGMECQAGKCAGTPEGCGDIAFEGCCDGEVLKYCEGAQLKSIDCSPNPACGWNTQGQYYDCGTTGGSDPAGSYPKLCGSCVPQCAGKQCGDDGCGGTCGTCSAGKVCQGGACLAQGGCGGVSYEGCCAGTLLKYCENGQLKTSDCAAQPQCGWDAQSQFYNCGTAGGSDPSGVHPKSCGG